MEMQIQKKHSMKKLLNKLADIAWKYFFFFIVTAIYYLFQMIAFTPICLIVLAIIIFGGSWITLSMIFKGQFQDALNFNIDIPLEYIAGIISVHEEILINCGWRED